MNRSPIRRHATKDPVTPELRQAVLERDQGCVAIRLFPFDGSERPCPHDCFGPLTLDHVQDGYGRMGKRAPSDMAHLAVVCRHHHLDGWATSHRPELRAYLEAVNERS